jgi:hypothetical protein
MSMLTVLDSQEGLCSTELAIKVDKLNHHQFDYKEKITLFI